MNGIFRGMPALLLVWMVFLCVSAGGQLPAADLNITANLHTADDLKPLQYYYPQLDAAQLAEIHEGAFIFSNSENFSGTRETEYMPNHSLMQSAAEIHDPEKNLTVESLHFIPYPDGLADSSDDRISGYDTSSSGSFGSRLLLTCFNTLRSLSTQEGITYISQRRGGKPHQLIETSYHVDSIEKKNRIDDPAVSAVPGAETDYVFQKDSSFGGNYFLYKYTVKSDGDNGSSKNMESTESDDIYEIYLNVMNLTPFRVFGLFKAIDRKSLLMHVSIIPVRSGIITYTAAQALGHSKTDISFLGMRIDLLESIQNRIRAVQEWFEERIQEEIGKSLM